MIQSKMLDYSTVSYTGDEAMVEKIKEKLQQGPLSLAVSAGNSCWRWYTGGILSEKDECPTAIDHGVALVGLA